MSVHSIQSSCQSTYLRPHWEHAVNASKPLLHKSHSTKPRPLDQSSSEQCCIVTIMPVAYRFPFPKFICIEVITSNTPLMLLPSISENKTNLLFFLYESFLKIKQNLIRLLNVTTKTKTHWCMGKTWENTDNEYYWYIRSLIELRKK